MRRGKSVSIFVLLTLLLGAWIGPVVAQEPQPPCAPEPSEPAITESSTLEWVTVAMEGGERQVLVGVHRLESVQTTSVPERSSPEGGAGAPNAMEQGVEVTRWRGMGWYPNGNPDDPETLWTVWTEARTTTDQCVDQVNVYAEHQYLDRGLWLDFWPPDSKYSSDADPCEDDSGTAVSGRGFYMPGTTHRSHGVHVVYIDGGRHQWDETGPGPRTVP